MEKGKLTAIIKSPLNSNFDEQYRVLTIAEGESFTVGIKEYEDGKKDILKKIDDLEEKIELSNMKDYVDKTSKNTEGLIDEICQKTNLKKEILEKEWKAFIDILDENIVDINIPQNVMKIEDMTFADCTSLENIKLPEKLQEIGVKAFSNTDLKEIVIPDGTKAIDIKAFENCKNLKTVVLPKSVEYIAVGAFDGCEKVNVKCVKGTYAEEYLKANKISYIAH